MSTTRALAIVVLFIEALSVVPVVASGAPQSLTPSQAAANDNSDGILLANGTTISATALASDNFYYRTLDLGTLCQAGGTLVIGLTADPLGLGGTQNIFNALDIEDALYPMLIHWGTTPNPQPDLAESWSVSPNGTVYTFNLVHNATWSDGVPITANDVAYTFNKIAPTLNQDYNSFIGNVVKDWVVVNNYTVSAVLTQPSVTFLLNVGRPNSGKVLPAHMYDGSRGANFTINNPQNPQISDPVTGGPFTFQQWVHGDHVTIVKNPNYYRAGTPILNEIIFKVIPATATLYDALVSGEINGVVSSTAANEKEIKGTPGIVQFIQYQSNYSSSWTYMIFNFRLPLFNGSLLANGQHNQTQGLLVRQAFAYSFPYQQVLSKVFLNESAIGGPGPYPAGSYAYNPNAITYTFNPTKAAQLLNEAGYKPQANGTRFSVTLSFDSGANPNTPSIYALWQQALSQIGVNLILDTYTSTSFIAEVVGGQYNFDIIIGGQAIGPDYASGTLRDWDKAGILPGEKVNDGAYYNPQLEALVNQVYTSTTLTQEGQVLGQIEALIQQQVPTFMVAGSSTVTTSVSSNVLGLYGTPGASGKGIINSAWSGYQGLQWACFAAAAVTSTAAKTSTTGAAPVSTTATVPASTTAASSAPTSSSITTTAIVAAIAVVVIGAVAAVMIRMRRKPTASTTTTATT